MKIDELVRAMSPPRYTIAQAAVLVGRSRDTLRRWKTPDKHGEVVYRPSDSKNFGMVKVDLYTPDDIVALRKIAKDLKPGRKAKVRPREGRAARRPGRSAPAGDLQGSVVPLPPPVQTLIDFATAVGGTEVEVTDTGGINFALGAAVALAYTKNGGSRIRGSVFLGSTEDPDEARRWVDAQPQPESGVLEDVVMEEGAAETYLRILFERPFGHVPSSSDTLLDDAMNYVDAWEQQSEVAERGEVEPFRVPGDPRDVEPANGWLLKGTEPSFFSEQTRLGYTKHGQRGVFELLWTTARQTEVGDLALVYFLSPRKAVHFVARAASRAFYDSSIEVAAEGDVADEQWWAYFTPLIEIDPISVKVLREHNAGYFPLRGRAGGFLRPDMIAALPIRAKRAEDQAELDRVAVTPVGRADLPKPEEVTMEMWPHIASGAMPLEAHVSQHVVEPLLRFALVGTSLTWRREYPVGRKWADYAVLDDQQPRCVIEVKVAIRESRDGLWSNSKDFAQMRHYATELGCPGILIDANRVLLVATGADSPYRIVERRLATADDFAAIRQHMTN